MKCQHFTDCPIYSFLKVDAFRALNPTEKYHQLGFKMTNFHVLVSCKYITYNFNPLTPPTPQDHQATNVLCFADSEWWTGILTKELFCGVLGLCAVRENVSCEKLTSDSFSSVKYVKRPSRKSKSKAKALISQLAKTGDV